jgi:hypothetical protein
VIDILSTMQAMLREAGFATRLTSIERAPVLCFEDEDLMGFGRVFREPGDLLANWKTTETSLLRNQASSIRTAGEKAWNVYCLFLCSASADPIQNRQVRWIEEDLDHTRKIAACGLGSREDLLRALLPVLPLQYQPALRAEDVTERLLTRIRTIAPRASHVVLDEAVPAAEVARLLWAPA